MPNAKVQSGTQVLLRVSKWNSTFHPLFISADFTKITEEIKKVETFEDSFVHLDIMDGNFVPNITFGPFIVEQIRKITKLPFDTHLMIKDPDRYIELFAASGSDFITFHIEESSFPLRILERIKNCTKNVAFHWTLLHLLKA